MKMIYIAIKIAKVSTWFVAISSIAGFGVAGYLRYKNKDQASVTPDKEVHPAENKARKSAISMVGQNNGNNEIKNEKNMNEDLNVRKY